MVKTLSIDIETYCELDLRDVGVYRYAEHESFEILMLAYSFDNGPLTDQPVEIVDFSLDEAPEELLSALNDSSVVKSAHNASFERTCMAKWFNLPMPPEEWRCTMVDSTRIGLPAALGQVAEVLKLDEQKDKAGTALISYFSKPCKPTKANEGRTRNLPQHDPEKWQLFLDYCKQDVEVERKIRKKIDSFPVPQFEQDLWSLDQTINDRGVQVDPDLMEGAVACDIEAKEKAMQKAVALTGLANPNSPPQMLEWLKEQGAELPNMQKATIDAFLDEYKTGPVHEALKLRQELSKSSIKKYGKMRSMVCDDNRVRGILQFYGASKTGRWAGRGVQVQNLTKNKMSLSRVTDARELIKHHDFEGLDILFSESQQDILSQLVRTCFVAKAGHKFVVSDFSAIEARVIAWFAGEDWRLRVFETHGKIYEASASQMFKVPIEEIGKGSPLRQKGKVAELACIAEGQLVLTHEGLVPIEEITTAHLVWDGLQWVEHQGVIYKGEKGVITYDGLTATTDHLVWIAGFAEPIEFGRAAEMGARLVKSGDGRRAARLGRDYLTSETVAAGLERPEGLRQMYRLRKRALVSLLQSKKWKIQRMPKLFTASENSEVAGPEIHSGQTALYKSERWKLQELRRSRNRVSVPFRFGSRLVDDRESGSAGKAFGNRSHRRGWPLRTWEPSVGDASRELPKSAKVYDILNAGPRNRFTVSNALVHNCGYQGGPGALKTMGALEMGLEEKELKGIIDAWRKANPNIVKFWYACNEAALTAVRDSIPVTTHGVTFRRDKGFLLIDLPSGRSLSYAKPHIVEGKFGDAVAHFGLDERNKWSRVESYGGKWVENIVQAVARDLLAVSMVRLERAGYPIVMHVHDEVVLEVPETEEDALSIVETMMGQPVSWAPGLPLEADGFETRFYKKD